MPSAKFVLKEPNSKGDTLIYLFYNFNYQRFKYSTGEKVPPKFWNSGDQRVRETKQFPLYPQINTRLDDIEQTIDKAYRDMVNRKIKPTPERLKRELDASVNQHIVTKTDDQTDLFSFISLFIEESKHLKRPNTLKNYNSTFNHLKEYCAEKKIDLTFADITLDFYNSFSAYLIKDKELSNNTVGKYFKTLKAFLNEATDRDLNTTFDYKKKKFKVLTEDVDKVYLNQSELDILYSLDLTAHPHLDRVRDLFMIGCYTGLRFSDFSMIKPENIVNGNKIKMRTTKTNELVYIPIHPKVKSILSKYKNHLPESISNQKTNKYLKEIGQLCKLNTLTQKTVTKAGSLTTTTTEKFNLISTHTARRSFATNAYLAGIPSISIMKITGHKTEKAFLSYIRVTAEQNADNLLNHKFFK